MADNVELDYPAIHDLLNSMDGPVGRLLDDLSQQVVAVARRTVRVRHGNTWSPRSDARPEGFTLANIEETLHYDGAGRLWGGAGAPEDPALFLEEPAEQIRTEGHRYPFLTTGLDSLVV